MHINDVKYISRNKISIVSPLKKAHDKLIMSLFNQETGMVLKLDIKQITRECNNIPEGQLSLAVIASQWLRTVPLFQAGFNNSIF
jgi:hypothetical protein